MNEQIELKGGGGGGGGGGGAGRAPARSCPGARAAPP
eukprot:COSAG04_NODE_742_length_10668_cov_6.485855_15_plen_36_part_01